MTSSKESQHWHYAEFDDRNFQIRGRTLFFVVVVFSIVLLLTILFLYARWIFRYSPGSPATTSASNVIHAPPQRHPKPQGLNPDSINSLPIIFYRPSNSELVAECSICLGIFVEGDKVKMLPNCRHCYHSECVDKWLTSQSSCPLCRGSLRVDSIV